MSVKSVPNIKVFFALVVLFLLPLHGIAQSKDENKPKDGTKMMKVMKELNVKGKRQLMTVIKDTVVFDTQALGMSDDTMLGDMMRLLPGIEISNDGKIFFNGKEVKRLRLNGRDFFRQSKKVMLENLTSLVVDKIKVYNESPEYAYLYSKIKSKVLNGELTVDVILKKEYRVGLFGHVSSAGGHSYDKTDKGVYNTDLFGVATTGKSTVGGLANANNQNRSVSMVRTSMFNKMGNDKGQATSQSLGVNFTNKNGERNLNFNSTIQMEHSDALLQLYEEEYNSQSFNRWRTNSEKDYHNNKWNVRWDHEQSFKWKSAYFNLKPEIEYTRNRDWDL